MRNLEFYVGTSLGVDSRNAKLGIALIWMLLGTARFRRRSCRGIFATGGWLRSAILARQLAAKIWAPTCGMDYMQPASVLVPKAMRDAYTLSSGSGWKGIEDEDFLSRGSPAKQQPFDQVADRPMDVYRIGNHKGYGRPTAVTPDSYTINAIVDRYGRQRC